MPFVDNQSSRVLDSLVMAHVLLVFRFWSGLKQSPWIRSRGQSFLLQLIELLWSAPEIVIFWQSHL